MYKYKFEIPYDMELEDGITIKKRIFKTLMRNYVKGNNFSNIIKFAIEGKAEGTIERIDLAESNIIIIIKTNFLISDDTNLNFKFILKKNGKFESIEIENIEFNRYDKKYIKMNKELFFENVENY